jgi:hypothetical protein
MPPIDATDPLLFVSLHWLRKFKVSAAATKIWTISSACRAARTKLSDTALIAAFHDGPAL